MYSVCMSGGLYIFIYLLIYLFIPTMTRCPKDTNFNPLTLLALHIDILLSHTSHIYEQNFDTKIDKVCKFRRKHLLNFSKYIIITVERGFVNVPHFLVFGEVSATEVPALQLI